MKEISLQGGLEAIMFKYDPVGINFGTNTDEYHPEVVDILTYLNTSPCIDVHAFTIWLYELLIYYFDEDLLDTLDSHIPLAEDLLNCYKGYKTP